MFIYLHQWVPMGNWFAWVSQHLIPVVPPQAFSIDAHTTNSNDLVMSNADQSEEKTTHINKYPWTHFP